jgi:tRNA(Ile)-lysidine synthase
MEEWARGERYAFFNDLCEVEGYDYIATGHTADDQAETVLMRIMRGSGIKGLCAIAPLREDNVIRPLLNIKRALLRAWLMETNTMFREDPSNKDITYHRNLVRHKLLPAFSAREPLAYELLPRIAQEAFAAWQALLSGINKWSALYVVSRQDGQFVIRTTGLVDFPFSQEAIAEVLRHKRIRFDRRHVKEIASNATRTSGVFLLPGGWSYRCERDIIEFTMTGIKVPAAGTYAYELTPGSMVVCESANVCIGTKLFPRTEEPLCYHQDNMTVFLDADAIKGPIEFRNVKTEDVFQPLGCKELRNVKEFLKKRKKSHRGQGVVAEKNGGIIWIPGVQISHHCRVTPPTTAILKFSCKYIQ